jgi:hypothetical protein
MTIEGLIKEAYFKEEAAKPVPTSDLQKIAKVLNTAATLPYRPETYEAACGIMKIASQAFDDLLRKNTELEKLSGVREIIDDMFERGMISKDDIQEKTSALMKKNDNELEVVKEAIKLAGANLNTNGLFDSDPGTIGTSTSQRSMFDSVLYKE